MCLISKLFAFIIHKIDLFYIYLWITSPLLSYTNTVLIEQYYNTIVMLILFTNDCKINLFYV